ncbi:acetyl-CoA carboxylase biotin carboxyl carrier protein subunit [Kurthia massiliensis]|uniref:acetyl-CoA carboxylase biotin carboxyl carrier protein subunit n=1 Tax=Kurthia massiliensis TaxID=1033739 RepID=UPI0002892919|nr:acetyl-CoA carboxylase biotin carboxyl carrier protein subunit [Kurthia massiliensis]
MMIKSEMAGTVWKVLVKEGDTVEEGQEVVILESMKMEIPVEAEESGTVKRVIVSEGDFIELDADLVEVE